MADKLNPTVHVEAEGELVTISALGVDVFIYLHAPVNGDEPYLVVEADVPDDDCDDCGDNIAVKFVANDDTLGVVG